MKIGLEFLDRCAVETGFFTATLEKVIRLGEIAGDIGRDALLGRVLALKGGTALNLGQGPPRRLSVDLDFNYIGSRDIEQMQVDRPLVESGIERIARQRGYRVQRSRDEHAGRKMYLEYLSALGPATRIAVDLNFLFRVPLLGTERRELWQPGDLDRPTIVFVSLQEIVAGKLLALLGRTAARDVYDVAILHDRAGDLLSSTSFRSLFVALSSTLDHPLTRYGRERLDRVTGSRFEEQVREMLTAEEAIDLDEVKGKAWAAVGPLLELTANEREFVRLVNDEGELRLDLLFPHTNELANRLASHPAIQWKLVNVRHHRANASSQN